MLRDDDVIKSSMAENSITNCSERTLAGVLALLQKCLSEPRSAGFEDNILLEPDRTAAPKL